MTDLLYNDLYRSVLRAASYGRSLQAGGSWYFYATSKILRSSRSVVLGLLPVLFLLLACGPGCAQFAFAGGSGFAEGDLQLIDGRYMQAQVSTDPPILRGDIEDPVVLSIVIIDMDANPSAPVRGVESTIAILDDTGRQILAVDAYSPDESIVLNIIPDAAAQPGSGALITGEAAGGSGWLAAPGSAPDIRAPVFLEGGPVQIIITIKSIGGDVIPATGARTLTVPFIIGEFIPFSVDIDGAKTDLVFATYFDRIDKFSYDSRQKSIAAIMPFRWDSDHIESLQFLHAEYYIPKSVGLFEDHEILLSVNGLPYFGTVDRSGDEEIVVHFLISSSKLLKMLEQIPDEMRDYITFEIKSGKERQKQRSDASLDAGDTIVVPSSQEDWKFYVSIDPAGPVSAGEDLVLNIEFRDPVTGILVPLVTYDISVLLDGKSAYSASGRETPDGTDDVRLRFEESGAVIVRISNINSFDTHGEFAFQVRAPEESMGIGGNMGDGSSAQSASYDRQVEMATGSSVPGCERSDACFSPHEARIVAGQTVSWVNLDGHGHTVASGTPSAGPDGIFESTVIGEAMRYGHTFDAPGTFGYYCTLHPWMTGVVVVAVAVAPHDVDGIRLDGTNDTTNNNVKNDTMVSIPTWIRSSAQWWAEGLISDAEFAGALEFLIENKVIVLLPAAIGGDAAGAVPGNHTAGRQSGGEGDHNDGTDTTGGPIVIPPWVRSSAQWWADGAIDDATFVGAIQWMIANGVIIVHDHSSAHVDAQ